ncbi:MAG TPA: cupin domain-containing protein [Amycolatopsis sp.]|nr:cupin domain-containing protein [Amycolatopsis sp.]
MSLIIRAGEAEVLGLPPVTMELLADGDTGISTIRTKMAKGTPGPPPHHHSLAPELFYILDGGLHVLSGDDVMRVSAGDYLVVPAGTRHAFAAPEDTGAEFLFFMPGADRFDYFRLTDKVRRGEESPQRVLETQERFDNYFEDSQVWNDFLAG